MMPRPSVRIRVINPEGRFLYRLEVFRWYWPLWTSLYTLTRGGFQMQMVHPTLGEALLAKKQIEDDIAISRADVVNAEGFRKGDIVPDEFMKKYSQLRRVRELLTGEEQL